MSLRFCSCLFIFSCAISKYCIAQKTVFPIFTKSAKVTIIYDLEGPRLDSIASNFLADDIERVTSFRPKVTTNLSSAKGNVIIVGNIRSTLVRKFVGTHSTLYKELPDKWECFGYTTIEKPGSKISKAFIIAGSDARGTAYGVFTLSEKIGVSPWYWWADAPVKKKTELMISLSDFISSPPAVKYRGIFINDEDWGLQPWAAKTFEPETGDIGPKTYAKVFELLLRLKANLIWPAMHPSTKAFFHYPENVTTAEFYQIIIGSSHAEPMLRNNVGEWDVSSMGHFNYFTNKDKIYSYWEDRVRESSNIHAIYTLGMRGVHDGQMEGIKDLKDAVPVVEQIIKDERGMLAKNINKPIAEIPQVLTPYKEVLEIYDYGLKVPDDVTLVWPDDNYGYIARLNNENEISRRGGAGVYYHASYWGRPHDYLWLPSLHPSLLREEMLKAFETKANNLWVLNVGDIKPQEYNIQEFLDLAYDPTPFRDSRYTKQHLINWVSSMFGRNKGNRIGEILWKYYQLAFERKPEFMGWSQTEPETKTALTEFNHFYFGDEAQKRLDSYINLELEVKSVRSQMASGEANAFYELVYYPVVGASWINKKFLYRDKAYLYSKQNRLSAFSYAQQSRAAYDSIVRETEDFNTKLAGGKWKNIMSMKPRDLAVYLAPDLPELNIDSTNYWSIAPEGFVTKDSSLLQNDGKLSLPFFDNLNNQKYFVDIFLSKHQLLRWTASVSHSWIHLSQNSGLLTPEMERNQTRIWVDVNWSKASQKENTGKIIFCGDGKQITLEIHANRKNKITARDHPFFVENNGMISMQAVHFSKQVNKRLFGWTVVNGLGYTGGALQASPLAINGKVSTGKDTIRISHSFVEYEFYTFTPATPLLTVFSLPTHPVNNNFSVRYAVSIDDSPLEIVDTRTIGRSDEWKQNVLRNRAERRIEMPFLNSGKHNLKIYTVDPGVILDEIRIDLGLFKKAYSSVPETKMNAIPIYKSATENF